MYITIRCMPTILSYLMYINIFVSDEQTSGIFTNLSSHRKPHLTLANFRPNTEKIILNKYQPYICD